MCPAGARRNDFGGGWGNGIGSNPESAWSRTSEREASRPGDDNRILNYPESGVVRLARTKSKRPVASCGSS